MPSLLRMLALSVLAGCAGSLPSEAPPGSALALDTYEAPPPPLGASFEDGEVAPEEGGGHHHHHPRAVDAGAPGGHAHEGH